FAGTVAGMRSVTIRRGHTQVGISYLASVQVSVGDRVGRGQRVGTTGVHDGREAVHISLRRDGAYVDPERWACQNRRAARLRLLPPMLATLVEAPT
ncbi:MAG: hypothetical protein R3246_14505, partial [Acidimicrobiia bacterium]|nr:hypothetical protein [Acidimicrobiia bacterium]